MNLSVQNKEKQEIIEKTRLMLHKYYCENDVEFLIEHMDEEIVWLGTGEHEYAIGKQTVAATFRLFEGKVPPCNISDEQYDVLSVAPDVYLCSGRLWICTDPSTNMYLRVHQRITTIFRRINHRFFCCHIHISNPYIEMTDEDVGFPSNMAKQSCEYVQEQISLQREKSDARTAMLHRMSYEDSLTGAYNRNKFNQVINEETPLSPGDAGIGVACFDLNELKRENDLYGHSAGDALICRTVNHINDAFPNKVYRIGGDEFVVIETAMTQFEFETAICNVQTKMQQDGISCSVGTSYRASNCNIKQQFNEADSNMYEQKKCFYRKKGYQRDGRIYNIT